VEERGVPIARKRPVFLISLAMEGFLLGKNSMVLENKLFLDRVVLLVGWLVLEL